LDDFVTEEKMVMGDLMTVAELSALLRVPPSWIYAKTSGGGEQLPFLKLGRHLRFRRSEIEVWLAAQSRNSENRRVPN
jgi:excisionase family DNA binding protein